MKRESIILKSAAFYGAVVLSLIGIIVAESAETVKTGYDIARLNKIWQSENFEFTGLKKKYSDLTESGVVTAEARKNFSMKFPEPNEIIFIREGK